MAEFSIATARDALRYAIAAYPPEHGPDGPAVVDGVRSEFVSVVATQYHVWWLADRTVIAWRGTQFSTAPDVRDWITDGKFFRTSTPWGKVQQGFWEAFIVAGADWAETCERAVNRQMPILITGHSLGAGLATLAAHSFAAKLPVSVIVFGCPRVGNADFATDHPHAERIWRVTNNADLVARLPMAMWGYRFVGHETLLRPGESPAIDPSYLSRASAFWWRLPTGKVRDHETEAYDAALAEAEAAQMSMFHSHVETTGDLP